MALVYGMIVGLVLFGIYELSNRGLKIKSKKEYQEDEWDNWNNDNLF